MAIKIAALLILMEELVLMRLEARITYLFYNGGFNLEIMNSKLDAVVDVGQVK